MKEEREKNFERELPEGYKEALRINAKDVKTGIIFNAVAFVVLAVVLTVAFVALYLGGKLSIDNIFTDLPEYMMAWIVMMAVMIAYIILHELVHGIAYKSLTGEKLTFGLTFSCAFCGVPNIYTYRKTALIAVIAPFAVFSLIFIPLTVVLYFTSPLYFLVFAFILGLHVGGCSGDLYVTILLLTRFKDKKTLMRDTGPEQTFYIQDKESFN